jgi:hypothetical protein
MSDTVQIVGATSMFFFMYFAFLYTFKLKNQILRCVWCMVAALILGEVLF